MAAIALQNILTQIPFGRACQTATEAMTTLSVVQDMNLRFADNV